MAINMVVNTEHFHRIHPEQQDRTIMFRAVNSTYRVYNKEGDAETPPYSLNTLWDQPGAGDPIIMYGPLCRKMVY